PRHGHERAATIALSCRRPLVSARRRRAPRGHFPPGSAIKEVFILGKLFSLRALRLCAIPGARGFWSRVSALRPLPFALFCALSLLVRVHSAKFSSRRSAAQAEWLKAPLMPWGGWGTRRVSPVLVTGGFPGRGYGVGSWTCKSQGSVCVKRRISAAPHDSGRKFKSFVLRQRAGFPPAFCFVPPTVLGRGSAFRLLTRGSSTKFWL